MTIGVRRIVNSCINGLLPGARFPVAGTVWKGVPVPWLVFQDAKVTGRLWRIAVENLDAASRF